MAKDKCSLEDIPSETYKSTLYYAGALWGALGAWRTSVSRPKM